MIEMPTGLKPSAVRPRTWEGRALQGTRGGGVPSGTEPAAETDSVELVWEDGTCLVVQARDLPTANALGVVTLPRLGADRDGAGTALASVAVRVVAEGAARLMARKIDRVDTIGDGRVFGVDAAGRVSFQPASVTESAGPALVLLHGTFSSGAAAFGDLLGNDGWNSTFDHYGGRVWIFDHPTLGQDPLANAVGLASILPEDSRLHLLTHSRGGLVGDVLAAACSRKGERRPGGFPLLDERFEQLAGRCREKNLVVERTLRVACPARGTTLASGRLDVYLNVLLNAIRLVPALQGSGLYDAVRELLVAFVKERDDASILPGLAAMSPDGDFVRWLATRTAEDDLQVVRGDASRPGLLKRLTSVLANLFFLDRNDLVVDVDAMDGGAVRIAAGSSDGGPLDVRDDPTSRVDHFCYFRHPDVLKRIARRFQPEGGGASSRGGGDDVRGNATSDILDPLSIPADPDPTVGLTPIVIVVPDVFGSALDGPSGRTWPAVDAIERGQLGDLALDAQIRVTGVLRAPWDRWVRQSDIELDAFAYDWRRSSGEAADALVGRIEMLRRAWPERTIHILAHGTGGLVARALLLGERRPSWNELRRLGGRLVLVGVPHTGTWRAVELMIGSAPLSRLVDRATRPAVGGILARGGAGLFRSFPGLLETLPVAPGDGTAGPLEAGWWSPGFGGDAQLAGAIDAAARFREKLDRDGWDEEGMVDVVGRARETPSVATWKEGPPARLEFSVSDAGDGVVCWPASTRLHTYVVDATHGSIISDPEAVEGLSRLLATGSTTLLRPHDPARLPSPRQNPAPAPRPSLYPRNSDLLAAALEMQARTEDHVLTVEIIHGNIALAEGGVVVTHVAHSALGGPEPALDVVLEGELSRRLRLGRYPQRQGEVVILQGPPGNNQCAPSPGPDWVAVAGLGAAEDTTRARVVEGVRQSVLEIALAEKMGNGTLSFAPPGSGRLGLTSAEAVSAMLEGVILANRALRGQSERGTGVVLLARVVVPYGEEAADCLRSAARWAEAPSLPLGPGERVRLAGPIVKGQTDTEKFVPLRPPVGRPAGRFRRLSARRPLDPGASSSDIEYVLPGDAAGAPREVVKVDWSRVHDLAATLTDTSTLIPDRLRALADHLLPVKIQEQFRTGLDLQLGLDRDTAGVPWEAFVAAGVDANTALSGSIAILRQLEDAHHPEDAHPVGNGRALVICSPGVGADRLSEAPAESEAVRARLVAARYAVEDGGSEAITVLQRLAGPHEIVHLVGHGQFVAGRPDLTGFRVGEGQLVSRLDLRSLERDPPALVFLNACSLAQLDGPPRGAQPLLAADLASQLIGSGVRAVVAAGWKVNDAAASAFAEAFYGELLDGQPFRDAVAAGRIAARRASPDTATWAAYQCYGDPTFVLPTVGESRGVFDDDLMLAMPLDPSAPNRAVTKTEVEDLLGQLVVRARFRTSDQNGVQRLVRRAVRFFRELPDEIKSGTAHYRMAKLMELQGPPPSKTTSPPTDDAMSPSFWYRRAAERTDAPLALLKDVTTDDELRHVLTQLFPDASRWEALRRACGEQSPAEGSPTTEATDGPVPSDGATATFTAPLGLSAMPEDGGATQASFSTPSGLVERPRLVLARTRTRAAPGIEGPSARTPMATTDSCVPGGVLSGQRSGDASHLDRLRAARRRIEQAFEGNVQWGRLGVISLPDAWGSSLAELVLAEVALAEYVVARAPDNRRRRPPVARRIDHLTVQDHAAQVARTWHAALGRTRDHSVLEPVRRWLWEVLRALRFGAETQPFEAGERLLKELQRQIPSVLDDANAGEADGRSERDGLSLSANVRPAVSGPLYDVDVIVAMKARPDEPVRLTLHQTFKLPVVLVPQAEFKKQKAHWTTTFEIEKCWGAFTVVARYKDVRVELDLGTADDAPPAFRGR